MITAEQMRRLPPLVGRRFDQQRLRPTHELIAVLESYILADSCNGKREIRPWSALEIYDQVLVNDSQKEAIKAYFTANGFTWSDSGDSVSW